MKITIIAISALFAATSAFASHELEGRDIVSGQTLYKEHCSSCHGPDLEGQPNWQSPNDDGTLPAPPHDEAGHTWHHDNQLLFDYTALGGEAALEERGITNFKSGMPGFLEVISEDEIWNILAYIHSTWPERIQDIQTARNRPHN